MRLRELGAPLVPADTQSLCCRLGCRLFPDGTARSFYEVTLNGTAFLSFHVPNATWQRRWPGGDAVAAFAQRELMKYPKTTQDLQYFLNTTCVSILRAQSAGTGPCRGWRGGGQGDGWGGPSRHLCPCRLLQKNRAAGRTLRWCWV